MEFNEVIDTDNFCDPQQPGNITDCHGVQRIAVILDCYKEWSQTASNNDADEDEADGFYGFMHDSLNYAKDENSVFLKLINDYNHLLFHHNDRDSFEILYNFFNQHIYDNKGCELDICHMLERNNRDRSEITKHEDRRSTLYHGFESSKEITIQQTVDRIHCQYLHCYDMGYKLTRKERQSVQETKIDDIDEDSEEKSNNNDDEDALLYTIRLRKVSSILTEKRNRDSRGRRNNRKTSNKFTTIIDDKKEQKQQDEQEQQEEEEEKQDLPNLKETASHKINLKLRVGLERDGPEGNEYSFSYRYYYWKAYIKTDHQAENMSSSKKNILSGLSDAHDLIIEPGNYGYKTWDWYIPKRYMDLKTEITQNKICTIGVQQFEDCVVKAQGFMQCDEIGKKLKSYGEWIYKYDICDDEPIQLQHIISLLLYCNYDILQAKFSSTFRRLHIHEKDEQLKKRHREFAVWGRCLREAVELYGDNIRGQYTDTSGDILINQSIKRLKFYHGINCQLLFPRTIARFNGPTSTTITISVAMAFAGGSDGLCLQLIRKDPEYKHSSFFNCVPLSDFTYEEERFFIGGLEPLQIATIIHTSTNTNYRVFIRSLNNIQNFIEGTNDGWAIHRVNRRMKKYIWEMFTYCHSYDEDELKQICLPQYILNLFRAYTNSVTRIDLNLQAINSEKSVQGKYGFKRIRNLIMIDNDDRQWVKMDTLGNIFRKCKELHVRSGYSINMVKLNKELMGDLLGFIQSNNVIERFQQLFKICIYQPQQKEIKLQKAVKKYKKDCKKSGWILDCDEKNKILKLTRNQKKH